MSSRWFDVAVLGAGPAGLVAALSAAGRGDVVLVADRLPREDDPPRVDAVPAGLVALLVELGVDPGTVGVDRLHELRWIAWSSDVPRIQRLAPAAHLERPRLECVLLSHAMRHPRVTLLLSKEWARGEGVFWGDGWRSRRLIDATGRAAVTADSVTRPARPWAARSLWVKHRRDGRGPAFALAAWPDGYTYRIGARACVVVGFVGRGSVVEGGAADLEGRLRSRGGGWMIDDLPPLASFVEGRAATASVQWSAPSTSTGMPGPLRIGEAALARDPLSSQGIATACSEALFVTSLERASDVELFELRQIEQRHAHLAALKTMLDGCRFSEEPTWRSYAEFIARHAEAATADHVVVLRDEKIVRLPARG
jgi:2-polyprenyl-6-methoxyphenol hydroxylase-like FAD-dependent oxidoreductase